MIRHLHRHHATLIHPPQELYKGNKEPRHITRLISRIIQDKQKLLNRYHKGITPLLVISSHFASIPPCAAAREDIHTANAKMADESAANPTSPPPEYTESATSSVPPQPSTQTPTAPNPNMNPEKPALPPRKPTSTTIPSRKPIPSSSSGPAQPISTSPDPTPNSRDPARQPPLLQQAKGALPTSFAGAKDGAVKYGKFILEHVKKGEMPWTQGYCCGVVGGSEVRSTFHFFQ